VARLGQAISATLGKDGGTLLHEVIADNAAIAEYVKQAYGVDSHVIAYGGDHAMSVDAMTLDEYNLPETYAFSVCRIEPENNVHLILKTFSKLSAFPLVIVGNCKKKGDRFI
jgi:glycosyltransferase involved in cell wall biosynthesis